MKFKVREGFLCEVKEKVEVSEGQFETQSQSFYGGKAVDLTPEQAKEHAHKLEPVDKAATEFLAAMHVAGPEASVQVDIDKLVAEKVAAAMTIALAAQNKAPA